jgi:hypothetical protein
LARGANSLVLSACKLCLFGLANSNGWRDNPIERRFHHGQLLCAHRIEHHLSDVVQVEIRTIYTPIVFYIDLRVDSLQHCGYVYNRARIAMDNLRNRRIFQNARHVWLYEYYTTQLHANAQFRCLPANNLCAC